MRGCEGEGAVSKQTDTKTQYIKEHIYSEGWDIWQEEWLNNHAAKVKKYLTEAFPLKPVCVTPLQ